MTVTVSAWFGVALVLSACFWLGVWARPRVATLRRRIGGSPALGRASERGKAGTVERVRTYTECSTAGRRRADTAGPATHHAASKTPARIGSGFASAGSRGEGKQRDDAADAKWQAEVLRLTNKTREERAAVRAEPEWGEWVRSPHSSWERRERTIFGPDEDETETEWRLS